MNFQQIRGLNFQTLSFLQKRSLKRQCVDSCELYTFRSSDILFLRMTIRTEHESIVTISLPVDDEHSSSTTFSNDYYATITIDISNVRHLDRGNDRNDNRRRVKPCEKNKPVGRSRRCIRQRKVRHAGNCIYSYTVNLRGSHSGDWPCEAVHAIALGQTRPRFAAINVNLRVHSNHATFTINNILHIYV